MATRTDRFSRNLITALFRQTTLKQPSHKPSAVLAVGICLVLAWVGFYTGHFTGSAATSVASTIAPLLFGLLSLALLHDVRWLNVVAIAVFSLCFAYGHKIGQHVDEPATVNEVMQVRNVVISDAIFDELTLLDAQMRKLQFDTRRHNSILYGIGFRIAENESLKIDQQLEQLRNFRSSLLKLTP